MDIPMPEAVKPRSILDYAREYADFDRQHQLMRKSEQQQADAHAQNQAQLEQEQFKTSVDKHQLAQNMAAATIERLDSLRLPDNDVEGKQAALEKIIAPMRKHLAKMFNEPEMLTKPADEQALRALAQMTANGKGRDNFIIVYDEAGRPHAMNKASGMSRNIVDENTGEPIVGSAQYTPSAVGARERAKSEEQIINVTDDQGSVMPMRAKDAVGSEPTMPQQQQSYSNNVGNIRPVGKSTGFQTFNSPQDGIAAVDKQLEIYGSKHGINTLAGVINRWSPPNENRTSDLVKNASKMLGINPNQEIDLSDPVQRHMITAAIMRQENPVFQRAGRVKGPSLQDKSAQKIDEYRQMREIDASMPKPVSELEQFKLDEAKAKKDSNAETALMGIDESVAGIDELMKIQKQTRTGPLVSNKLTAGLRQLGSDIGLDEFTGGKNLTKLKKGYAEEALKAISAFRAIGVTFGAMSDAEGRWVQNTKETLDSDGEINLEMLAKGKALLQKRRDLLLKNKQGAAPSAANSDLQAEADALAKQLLSGE